MSYVEQAYTVSQCEAEVQAIDAEIARVRKLADAHSIGGGRSFDHRTTIQKLHAERDLWLFRRSQLLGNASPYQPEVFLS